MAFQTYGITTTAGALPLAIGVDAGTFSIRVSRPMRLGGASGEAESEGGFPLTPVNEPFTLVLDAGESVWAYLPVSAETPSGTPATIYVAKNTT